MEMVRVACKLDWDKEALASAMGITIYDVNRMFKRDGRIYPHILKPRLARELNYREYLALTGSPAPAQLIDDDNGLWQIRTVTKGSGVSFMQQTMRSSLMEYNEQKFVQYIRHLAGYLVCDIRTFPELIVYQVPSDVVCDWQDEGFIISGLMAYGTFKQCVEQPELPL